MGAASGDVIEVDWVPFPPQPVSPRVFFEEWLPALFASLEADSVERALELELGVILRGGAGGEEGDEGGEWTLHFSAGELGVRPGRAEDCAITIIQRVEDWRSVLWEGRPALIADAVAATFASDAAGLRPAAEVARLENPDALKGLSQIQGLIEAIIASEEVDAEDWRIGIQIGPGPIPESPQATILLGVAQADAIRRGDLHPLEALMTGQLRLEGDLGLIIQLQAVAMTASMPKPPSRGSG